MKGVKNMLKCNLKQIERISKNGTSYNITCIELMCDCGVSLVIEDFKVKIPFSVNNLNVNIELVNNRYVIKEVNYTIGWAYNLGVSLLLNHSCNKI